MNVEHPPYGTRVETIERLCASARDARGRTEDALRAEVDDVDDITFERTLEAAVAFGLFEPVEDEPGAYRPTTEGKRLGYGRLSEGEREEFFRELVADYEFYTELLRVVEDRTETTEDGEETYLARDAVQTEMAINFDLGLGDRKLKSAAGMFLQVLEECGFGRYTRTSASGLPPRLVLDDDSDFGASSSGAGESSDTDGSATPAAADAWPDEGREQSPESRERRPTGGGSSPGSRPSERAEASSDRLAALRTLAEQEGVEINVSIDVAAADLSAEELAALLETVEGEQ